MPARAGAPKSGSAIARKSAGEVIGISIAMPTYSIGFERGRIRFGETHIAASAPASDGVPASSPVHVEPLLQAASASAAAKIERTGVDFMKASGVGRAECPTTRGVQA